MAITFHYDKRSWDLLDEARPPGEGNDRAPSKHDILQFLIDWYVLQRLDHDQVEALASVSQNFSGEHIEYYEEIAELFSEIEADDRLPADVYRDNYSEK